MSDTTGGGLAPATSASTAPPMPKVRAVSTDDIRAALSAGIDDFRRAPVYGFLFGGIYMIGGLLVLGSVTRLGVRVVLDRDGADLAGEVEGDLTAGGPGSDGVPVEIDCGNSGTSLRLLTGVLSGLPGLAVLTGDASLRKRPVRKSGTSCASNRIFTARRSCASNRTTAQPSISGRTRRR